VDFPHRHPPATIRHYLTQNIHYTLSPACIEAVALFRRYAAEAAILPRYPPSASSNPPPSS